jgi:hypothetical protein
MPVALRGYDDCLTSGDFEWNRQVYRTIPAPTDRIHHSSCKMTFAILSVHFAGVLAYGQK